MKRLFLCAFFAVAAFLGISASAANGDIAGTIYSTDILTQLDGRDIPSYNIDGRTMIALEDLEQYGFNVKYDDSIRAVFINDTGECPSDFKPSVPRGKAGEAAGYYYESDISAYVNGMDITAFSLDGKMAACVEDLGNINNAEYDGISPYLMSYTWNESERLLSLYTCKSKLPDTDTIKDNYKNRSHEEYFGWFFSEELPTADGCLLIGGSSGTSHGTYMNYTYLRYSDKLYMNINGVLRAYGFRDVWGHLRVVNMRTEGETLIFDGTKHDGRSGTYRLDMPTFEMSAEEETGPDKSKASEWDFPESPVGKPVVTSGINVTVDDKPVQAYTVSEMFRRDENRTLIAADVLTHFGFTKSEEKEYTVYMKNTVSDTSWSDTIRSSGENAGTIAFSDKPVSVNGFALSAYDVNGIKMIDADYLWNLTAGKGTANYELYCRYGVSPALIRGEYDSESNTLRLDTSGKTGIYFERQKELVSNIYGEADDRSVKTVIADTAGYFAVKYKYDYTNDAEAYLAFNNGITYQLHEIFYTYGIGVTVDFYTDGTDIVGVGEDGTVMRFNTDTLTVTK